MSKLNKYEIKYIKIRTEIDWEDHIDDILAEKINKASNLLGIKIKDHIHVANIYKKQLIKIIKEFSI